MLLGSVMRLLRHRVIETAVVIPLNGRGTAFQDAEEIPYIYKHSYVGHHQERQWQVERQGGKE